MTLQCTKSAGHWKVGRGTAGVGVCLRSEGGAEVQNPHLTLGGWVLRGPILQKMQSRLKEGKGLAQGYTHGLDLNWGLLVPRFNQ